MRRRIPGTRTPCVANARPSDDQGQRRRLLKEATGAQFEPSWRTRIPPQPSCGLTRVLRWHRQWRRHRWTRRSKRLRPDRPCYDATIRAFVGKIAAANPRWGAPRIHGELLKLGFTLSEPDGLGALAATASPAVTDVADLLTNHVAMPRLRRVQRAKRKSKGQEKGKVTLRTASRLRECQALLRKLAPQAGFEAAYAKAPAGQASIPSGEQRNAGGWLAGSSCR